MVLPSLNFDTIHAVLVPSQDCFASSIHTYVNTVDNTGTKFGHPEAFNAVSYSAVQRDTSCGSGFDIPVEQ